MLWLPTPRPKLFLKAPYRECAITREVRPKAELIRFVRGPDGAAVPDVREKLPGRGAWVTASRETVDEAVQKDAFSRRFKAKTAAPVDLSDQVEQLLAQQALGLLGMAQKAGLITTGFDKVRDAIRKSRPAWLIEAADGAEDGRRKVYSLAKALYTDVEVAGGFTSAELGMALGREGVIHALLRPGPLAKSFTLAYGRLTGFRPSPEDHWFSAGDP
ncbi:MAG: RNA-binding protein [Pseudomonadota bacterium]